MAQDGWSLLGQALGTKERRRLDKQDKMRGVSRQIASSGMELTPQLGGEAQQAASSLMDGGMDQNQAFEQIFNNPRYNPQATSLMDQQAMAQDQQMAEASLLQGERSLKNEVDVAKENRARTGEARAQQTFDMNIAEGDRAAQSQLQNAARDIAVVQDYSTMLKEVGTETFKTQDRGILGAQRFQMLDMIRRTTEAGALQQAEIELFNAIIPEYDEWIKLTTGEREGKLQQFEYWMKTKAQDKALAAGLTYADIPELGRTYQEMTRPLPDGFQSGM
jgi:hypothetical protein